jgi:hypothetical protein
MLLLEGYISNFTRARYYFLRVEFSDFYVNQSLAGQTIPYLSSKTLHVLCQPKNVGRHCLSIQKKNNCNPYFIVIMITVLIMNGW